jgi:ABC-type transporter Mla MlaB component
MKLDIDEVGRRRGEVDEEMEAAREGTMNEHEDETRKPEQGGEFPVLVRAEPGRPKKKGDLVVDLSGIKKLDLTSLALLLTAQQKAEKEDRDVWLAGVPLQVWQALTAMGLGRFFKPFPVSGEVAV